MLGRKYWAENLLSELSAQKEWAEGSTRFPRPDSLSGSNAGFYVGTISTYHQAGSTQYPLPKFGSVTFQNVELRFSGGWVGLNTQQYQPVDLIQNTTTLLQVSPLNGESFTVIRLNP